MKGIKANDFEFAFENLVTNVSRATQMFLESTQDFVINGKVTPETAMRVEIAPIFGVCKSTGIPFGRTESEIMEYSFETSPSGRIDIIEVKGDWETYDEQQRAFNDPDTDTQTYQYVKTKKLMKPVYQIKQGTEGGSVAPEVDEGWVKLAEVVIQANANSLTEDDIKNITSDIAGENNIGWTTEADITYNIGYISDVNARFREQHNSDGTHKANVINAVSLDIGTGTNQINGNILPVGGSVSIPNETIAATDSILSVFVKAASMLTSLHGAYLKYGNYGFKGVLSISSLVNDGTDVLKKPISISAAGDGTAVIKVDNAAVLSIDATGKLSTNGYTPTSNNHLITKSVTDAINTALTALTNRVSLLEAAGDNTTYTNEVLSSGTNGRYNPDTTFIYAATTENITLSGTQTIDGENLTDGDLILVKDQTDAKENGIYSYASGSAWSRTLAFDTPTEMNGKLFTVSNGTVNKDKMFYVTQTEFTDPNNFGTDEIPIKEYFGSVKPLANKVIMRDAYGRAQVAAPVNPDDIARKADIDAIYTCVPTLLPADGSGGGSCYNCFLTDGNGIGRSIYAARADHWHIPAAAVCGCRFRVYCCQTGSAMGYCCGYYVVKNICAGWFLIPEELPALYCNDSIPAIMNRYARTNCSQLCVGCWCSCNGTPSNNCNIWGIRFCQPYSDK